MQGFLLKFLSRQAHDCKHSTHYAEVEIQAQRDSFLLGRGDIRGAWVHAAGSHHAHLQNAREVLVRFQRVQIVGGKGI